MGPFGPHFSCRASSAVHLHTIARVALRSIEEQLGVALFDRGAHSLTLTEGGRSYLQHLDALFARLETVTEQLQARYGRGVVRLHITPFFATEMLMPKLQSLLDAQPDTDIHINTVQALESHPADADVSIVVNAAPGDGLSCHKLFSQAFVPACSPLLLERNPIKGGLRKRAEDWPYSSASLGLDASLVLSPWPSGRPRDWLAYINEEERPNALAALRAQMYDTSGARRLRT